MKMYIIKQLMSLTDWLIHDPTFWTSEINELVEFRNRLNKELHKDGVYEF